MLRRLFCLLVLALGSTANAQFLNPYNWSSWNNPTSAHIDLLMSQAIQRKVLENSIAARTGARPARKEAAAAARLPLSATDFKAGKKGGAAATLAASLEGVEPAQRKQFEGAFNEAIAQLEADKGFRRNNVAYAVTFLVGASILVAYEKEITDAEQNELAAGINDVLGGDEGFKKMPARDKQELYEGCIVTGGLIGGLYSAGAESKDEKVKQQAQELARGVLAKFGVK